MHHGIPFRLPLGRGLKMVDSESFNKSLKVAWISKYLDPEDFGKWKIFFDLELKKYGGGAVFNGNLDRKDTTNALVIVFPEGGTPGCRWGNWGLCGDFSAYL